VTYKIKANEGRSMIYPLPTAKISWKMGLWSYDLLSQAIVKK
jgi:hypothetical protein